MFERRFPAETAQFLKGLQPYFLDDVLHFALPTRIAPRGRKNPWRIFLDQRFEARRVALQHRGDQLRFRTVHFRQYAKRVRPKSKSPGAWEPFRFPAEKPVARVIFVPRRRAQPGPASISPGGWSWRSGTPSIPVAEAGAVRRGRVFRRLFSGADPPAAPGNASPGWIVPSKLTRWYSSKSDYGDPGATLPGVGSIARYWIAGLNRAGAVRVSVQQPGPARSAGIPSAAGRPGQGRWSQPDGPAAP